MPAETRAFYARRFLANSGAGLRGMIEAVLEEALEAGEVLDAAIGGSEAQRAALWRIREEHPEAQRRAGASVKSDVSVPVSRTPELMRRCSEALRALVPGSVPVPFGHLGDGNIHMNLLQPDGMDAAAFLARGHEIMGAVNAVVRDLGGSPSAEHGVGRMKVADLARWGDPGKLAAMRAVKAALDPLGIMNPGRVFG